jgi:hypothetical protein
MLLEPQLAWSSPSLDENSAGSIPKNGDLDSLMLEAGGKELSEKPKRKNVLEQVLSEPSKPN